MKYIFTLIAFLTSFLSASSMKAADVPTFPSCTNPSGDIKVEYVSGQHAIVGESALREGSDKVYALFDGNVLQCFCPADGEGIQTNWWKLDEILQDEINDFKTMGWHFVPSGSAWGLSSDPYLAKNVNYDCKPDDDKENDDKNEESNGVGGGGGEVLSALAPTGDNWMMFLVLIFGVSLILAAIAIRKK